MRPGPPRREGCPPSPTFVSPGRGLGLEEGLEFDAGPGDCARSRAIAARIWALGCCLPAFPGRLGEWRDAQVRQPEAWRRYPPGIATGIVALRKRRPLLMDGRNPGPTLLQRRDRPIPVAEFIPLGCTASACACVQMRAPCAHRVNPANQLQRSPKADTRSRTTPHHPALIERWLPATHAARHLRAPAVTSTNGAGAPRLEPATVPGDASPAPRTMNGASIKEWSARVAYRHPRTPSHHALDRLPSRPRTYHPGT